MKNRVRWVLGLLLGIFSGSCSGPVETDPTSGGDLDATTSVTWCEALTVIQAKCQRCHTEPPQNGAPFALLEHSDLHQAYPPNRTDREVWQAMEVAVEIDFMPYTALDLDPPVQPLTAEEKSTLLAYLGAGAPPTGGTDCGN